MNALRFAAVLWVALAWRAARTEDGASGEDLRTELSALLEFVASSDDADLQRDLLKGLADRVQGRGRMPAPEHWKDAYAKVKAGGKADLVALADTLAVAFGDETLLAPLRALVGDARARSQNRAAAIEKLAAIRDERLPAALLTVLAESGLRLPALRALLRYDRPEIPAGILSRYASFSTEEKAEAISVLASRPAGAAEMLAAVKAGAIPVADLGPGTLLQLRELKNAKVDELLKAAKLPAAQFEDPEAKLIAYKALLTEEEIQKADARRGRKHFETRCMQCHTLFGNGGKVGPDLGGFARTVDQLLPNIVKPSATIAKEYTYVTVETHDDLSISGCLKQEDDRSVTIATVLGRQTIERANIAAFRRSERSMMPDGLLDTLSRQDLRELFAYLMGSRQVDLPETPEAAPTHDR